MDEESKTKILTYGFIDVLNDKIIEWLESLWRTIALLFHVANLEVYEA